MTCPLTFYSALKLPVVYLGCQCAYFVNLSIYYRPQLCIQKYSWMARMTWRIVGVRIPRWYVHHGNAEPREWTTCICIAAARVQPGPGEKLRKCCTVVRTSFYLKAYLHEIHIHSRDLQYFYMIKCKKRSKNVKTDN